MALSDIKIDLNVLLKYSAPKLFRKGIKIDAEANLATNKQQHVAKCCHLAADLSRKQALENRPRQSVRNSNRAQTQLRTTNRSSRRKSHRGLITNRETKVSLFHFSPVLAKITNSFRNKATTQLCEVIS